MSTRWFLIFACSCQSGHGAANDGAGRVRHQHVHSPDHGLAVGSVHVVHVGLALDVEAVDHGDRGGEHVSKILKFCIINIIQ